MARHRGIKKSTKRRNQLYTKKAKVLKHEGRSINNAVSAADISVTTPQQGYTNVEFISENCGDPNKGQRSASPCKENNLNLLKDASVNVNDISVTRIYDTPTKCIVTDVLDAKTALNPASHATKDRDEDHIVNDINCLCIEDSTGILTDDIDDRSSGSRREGHNSHFRNQQLINRITKPNQSTMSITENQSINHVTRNILGTKTINRGSNNVNWEDSSRWNMVDCQDSSINTPNGNAITTNNIDCLDDSFTSNNANTEEHNRLPINNTNEFVSYSTRRRHVRYLKQYIFSLGTLDVQACILLDLLNDSEMKNVVVSSGIKSPKESKFNEHIVNQVLKQISRSSSKSSTRGRVNDDKQSYKINMTAAMMRSPSSNTSPSLSNKNYIDMLYSKSSLSRSSARQLVIKAVKQRRKLTNAEKDTTWSIISQRYKYNTQQNSLNMILFEWILHHPHVITSPIHRDTILIKVPQPNGIIMKKRVGKLLLEISVRDLYRDLLKPPPVGLSEVYCPSTKNILISETYLRNVLPPQLRPITFSQKQLCGCECCTVMRMVHTSLIRYRKDCLRKHNSIPTTVTRSRRSAEDSVHQYLACLNDNEFMLSNDCRDTLNSMSCTNALESGIPKWNCILNRCSSCPEPKLPLLEMKLDSPLRKNMHGTYKFQTKCKVHGNLDPHYNTCVKCTDAVSKKEINLPEKLTKRKEITLLQSNIDRFHIETYIPLLKRYRYHMALVSILSKNHCKKSRFDAYLNNVNWYFSEHDYAERLMKQLDGEI